MSSDLLRVLLFYTTVAMSIDTAAFTEFERQGWNAKAPPYHELVGAISPRVAAELVEAAHIGPGDRVLDVACGPGYAAVAAAGRDASVIGVDIASAMVELATGLHPGLDFRVADCAHLPFADSEFDVVVSNFGLPHFPDPVAVVIEMARVTRPGGRVALSTHDTPQRSAMLGLPMMAVQQSGAHPKIALPPGPQWTRYSEDEGFRQLLLSGALADVEIRVVGFSHRTTRDELWSAILAATVRTAAMIESLDEADRRRVRALFDELCGAYAAGGDQIEIPLSAKIGSGRRAEKSAP
jgi:SAM-dependent methyltransferase